MDIRPDRRPSIGSAYPTQGEEGRAESQHDQRPANAETPIATLTRLLASMDDVPSEMVHTLLRGAPELDLRTLSNDEAACVLRLTPQIWAALQRCAQEGGGAGITALSLGRQLPVRRMLPALQQLTTLSTLTVSATQERNQVDLRGLQGGGMRLQRLQVQGDPDPPLTITVPTDTDVEAVDTHRTVLGKSLVWYADADGHVDPDQKPRPLLGSRHDRTTHESWGPPATRTGLNLHRQEEFRNKKFNGKTFLVGGERTDRTIVCRQLVMWWLGARMEHQASAEPGKHFSYGPVEDAASVEQLDGAALEQAVRNLLSSPPVCVFDQSTLAAAMTKAFEGLQPGERRHFAMAANGTPEGHMLGLELGAKTVQHGNTATLEYSLNLYDPENTAIHERLVVSDPSKLLGMDLTRWVNVRVVGELYPMPARVEAQQHGTTHILGANSRMLPEFRNQHGVNLMIGVEVKTSLDYFVTQAAQEPDGHAALARTLRHGMSLVWSGLLLGGTASSAAIVAYVRAVLALPSHALTAQEKFEVLNEIVAEGTTLNSLMKRGDEGAEAVLAAILSAPESALTNEHKAYLALASDFSSGQPALHALCSASPQSSLRTDFEQVYRYVLAIANANVPDDLKVCLFESAHRLIEESEEESDEESDEESGVRAHEGPGIESPQESHVEPDLRAAEEIEENTAAAQAMNCGNYGIAAAFFTAILDSEARAAKADWLSRLGVSASEVKTAISAATAGADREWAANVITKLTTCEALVPDGGRPLQ